MSFPHIVLHAGKERSLRHFHPWVFSGAIRSVDPSLSEGDIAEVYSAGGEYLGTGHYHEGSIKVRLFSFRKTAADAAFWVEKLRQALDVRRSIGLAGSAQTTAWRLVHAEGDGLPGLIVDVYGSSAVIQTHTLGMHRAAGSLAAALRELPGLDLETMYDKSADALSRQHQTGHANRYLLGGTNSSIVLENNLKFEVNWVEGQKTGFFLDQRDNRRLLSTLSKGKTVLNTFAYSAGFSVYALAGGAASVDSVDSSRKAKEWGEKNVSLNFPDASHRFYDTDVFDFLKGSDEHYDIVILDPPGFAKHKSAVSQASIGYRNLNAEGIRKVAPGGLLFTFSCSQVVDRELFRKLVFQAAAMTGRPARILHQLTQPPDHPVNLYHPEGEYLKGLVLRLD